MEMLLNILLFDKSDYLIEEIKIEKPKTYQDLLDNIKTKIKYLPKKYEIYFLNNNRNILLNNNENYKLIKNIIFIYEVNNLDESDLSLSKSEINIIDDKYTCNICKEKIKEDKPLLCYQCQTIYHKICLKKWDEICRRQNNHFNCPKCKFGLPLSDWKEKVNYTEERNHANFNDLDKNIIIDNKISKNKYHALKKEYKIYINKISKILERILKKSNDIVSLLNVNNNNNIKNDDKKNNPNDIYNMIFDNLIIVENYVKFKIYKKKEIIDDINNYMPNEINCIYAPKENQKEITLIHNYQQEYQFSIYDTYGLLKKAYLETKEINTKIFEDNTKLYINDKKVKFKYKLKLKDLQDLKEIKVRFKFSKVFTDTSYMFYDCPSLKSIDLSLFNSINLINTCSMFKKCSSLESVNLSSFYTTNINNMNYMFSSCSSLKFVDFSSFNTFNVITMDNMFSYCSSLEFLDLTSFNTNNVENMSCMFCDCSSLKLIDLSSFNTNIVKTMNCMFNECKSLKSIDLSSFSSNNVLSVRMMFNNCSSLESVDLSSFDITSEKIKSSMFSGCSSLKSIELSSFHPEIDKYIIYIFENCSSLKKENIKIKDQDYKVINLIFNEK